MGVCRPQSQPGELRRGQEGLNFQAGGGEGHSWFWGRARLPKLLRERELVEGGAPSGGGGVWAFPWRGWESLKDVDSQEM